MTWNAWLSFVLDALTVAFDNFTVPSRTIGWRRRQDDADGWKKSYIDEHQ
jgi:hypothetical protein